MEKKNLLNMRFGKLVVIDEAGKCGHNYAWLCKCDCGKFTRSTTYSLTSGRAKSCGCLGLENATKAKVKHNGRHTKLYKHWCNMKKRCNNPNHENYKYYGGRGIKICDEWNSDFAKFKEWALANGYEETLTIERKDVDGNYEPSNCKWITFKEQIRNRRNTVKLTYLKVTKPLIEWCEIYKLNYKLAHARYKNGWSFERIFNLKEVSYE